MRAMTTIPVVLRQGQTKDLHLGHIQIVKIMVAHTDIARILGMVTSSLKRRM